MTSQASDKLQSQPEILLRLGRLPNQAISVFVAFSWSFWDAHQSLVSATHAVKRLRIALVSETIRINNCLSLVNKWKFTACRVKTSDTSSVYEMNSNGSRTEPSGTLQSIKTICDLSLFTMNVCVRPDKYVWWRRGVAVERRIRDREVAGSSLGRALRRKNSGQVSHTYG